MPKQNKAPVPMAPQPANDREMEARITLFDKDFQAIQKKYMLRVIAQVILPGGAVLSVPIQVQSIGEFPTTTPEEQKGDITNPEE